MRNSGRFLIIFSIFVSVLFGFQIVAYFGTRLGIGIISLLFMGGVALSLVMSGHGHEEDDFFMESFLKESPKD